MHTQPQKNTIPSVLPQHFMYSHHHQSPMINLINPLVAAHGTPMPQNSAATGMSNVSGVMPAQLHPTVQVPVPIYNNQPFYLFPQQHHQMAQAINLANKMKAVTGNGTATITPTSMVGINPNMAAAMNPMMNPRSPLSSNSSVSTSASHSVKEETSQNNLMAASNRSSSPTSGDDKRFKCHMCNASFNRRFSLKRHYKRHTGERPYVCNYFGCGRRFGEKNTLKRHVISKHTNPLWKRDAAAAAKKNSTTTATTTLPTVKVDNVNGNVSSAVTDSA